MLLTTLLFVISFVCAVMFVFSFFTGKSAPVPLLHLMNMSFTNCYVYAPAFAYQTWFWFSYFQII